MKLRNIKAQFNLNSEIDIVGIRKIFKGCDATFTIHRHHRNVVHVTGVKSHSHLNLCIQYIQEKFDVKIEESIIDNQFFSYKDNKILDMNNIYKKLKETHIVYYERELSPAMIIKHENRMYPTILLFHTGSYTFMGGKMEHVKFTNNFIRGIICSNIVNNVSD